MSPPPRPRLLELQNFGVKTALKDRQVDFPLGRYLKTPRTLKQLPFLRRVENARSPLPLKSQPGARLAEDPSSPSSRCAGQCFLSCLCFFSPCLIFSRLQSPSPPPLQQLPFLGRTPSLHCLSVCTSWGAPVNSASFPEKAPPMTPSTSLCHVSLLRFSRERDTCPPCRLRDGRLSPRPLTPLQRGRRGPCGQVAACAAENLGLGREGEAGTER